MFTTARTFLAGLLASIPPLLISALSFAGPTPAGPNDALNAPDRVAWTLFLQLTKKASGGKPTFETWASDTGIARLWTVSPMSGTPNPVQASQSCPAS